MYWTEKINEKMKKIKKLVTYYVTKTVNID